MATTESLQIFEHSDKEVDTFLNNLDSMNVDSSYYLTVLAGSNGSAKSSFFKKLKNKVDNDICEIDLKTVVSAVESESFEKIDAMIKSLGSEKYVWLSNGDVLDGVYTGYSSSVRRYATPQEKYLLKKIKNTEKVYFIALEDEHTVTNFLRRHAQTLITFHYPSTFLGKLKQITLHGSSFSSSRQAIT